jgi:hypothetical protein
MSRYDYLASDPSLHATLDQRTVEDLKKLAALLPGVKQKAPRKGDLVVALEVFLLGGGVDRLWTHLKPLEQSAVAEAVHSDRGTFDPGAFHAKHGALPVFEIEQENRWRKNPTLLALFLHPRGGGGRWVPDDLRTRLRAFVPKPAATQLSTVEKLPERPPREWTSRCFDDEKLTTLYERQEYPRMVRLTEQAALQDLRTVLRLIDQEKISVSPKTFLPSKATMTLLNDLLRGHDFFELTGKVNSWDPEIGPMKAFSWPLLAQAARFATLGKEKFVLTKTGRAALETPPAPTLREIWNAGLGGGSSMNSAALTQSKGRREKGAGACRRPKVAASPSNPRCQNAR